MDREKDAKLMESTSSSSTSTTTTNLKRIELLDDKSDGKEETNSFINLTKNTITHIFYIILRGARDPTDQQLQTRKYIRSGVQGINLLSLSFFVFMILKNHLLSRSRTAMSHFV